MRLIEGTLTLSSFGCGEGKRAARVLADGQPVDFVPGADGVTFRAPICVCKTLEVVFG